VIAVRFVDAVPDVRALPSDLILGPDGNPYMTRHHVTETVRFHHLLMSDPQPDMHDHPWDFTSVLITGGYREHTLHGVVEHRAPAVVHRGATEAHRLELLDGPTWTLVATGPTRRRWGFHTTGGWVHWSRYPFAGSYANGVDATPRVTHQGARSTMVRRSSARR
jgi:hypothetical protein